MTIRSKLEYYGSVAAVAGSLLAIGHVTGSPRDPMPTRSVPGEEVAERHPLCAAIDDRLENVALAHQVLAEQGVTDERQRDTQLALMHHESAGWHADTTSVTGAAGLAMLTIRTASGQGIEPLYAPAAFFRVDAEGRYQWKPGARPRAYGEALRAEVAKRHGDPAALRRLDARFDPRTAIEGSIREYASNLRVARAHLPADDAYMVAAVMYNVGRGNVTPYLSAGASSVDEVVERIQRSGLDPFRKRQVTDIAESVARLRDQYEGLDELAACE